MPLHLEPRNTKKKIIIGAKPLLEAVGNLRTTVGVLEIELNLIKNE